MHARLPEAMRCQQISVDILRRILQQTACPNLEEIALRLIQESQIKLRIPLDRIHQTGSVSIVPDMLRHQGIQVFPVLAAEFAAAIDLLLDVAF